MKGLNSEDGNGEGIRIAIPIGFRFHPTDQELLLYYLRRKAQSLPLPASVIPEFDVFQSNPWDLPGDSKEKRYFFSKRKRSIIVNNCSSLLRAGCGYWKSTGKEYKPIVGPGSNLVIGIKKSLVFCEGKISGGRKAQWIMHQFCLVGAVLTPYLAQKVMIQVGDWVVCCVYQRKRKARNIGTVTRQVNTDNSQHKQGRMPSDDVEMGFSVSQASSSSSGFTEISSNDLDQEVSSQTCKLC
ncbi:hypothetical protein CDL12_25691 [Handroanthus impetiginosus]|uniref:NAC domain-containing protein n=1 Tax=Handroanthus impetiginosus TaxID=429701 RepID=A0A2G9G929_9LAMI|nr:hypothetical protein CDL12_25691 [Handroanthus impetiginosus]